MSARTLSRKLDKIEQRFKRLNDDKPRSQPAPRRKRPKAKPQATPQVCHRCCAVISGSHMVVAFQDADFQHPSVHFTTCDSCSIAFGEWLLGAPLARACEQAAREAVQAAMAKDPERPETN